MFKIVSFFAKRSLQSSVIRSLQTNPTMFAGKNLQSSALTYDTYGDPPQVIKKVDTTDNLFNKLLQPDEIIVQFVASPINPADINTIQGLYAIKPNLPAVAGNEGFGRIVKIGHDVKGLSVGDKVIPSATGFGTWRTHVRGRKDDFIVIDQRLSDFDAAQLSVNPCTAYRMLKDFIKLRPGDTIIQNGANSAVGLCVIQLARELGVKTINVIRARKTEEDTAKLKQELSDLGANFIVTESELRSVETMNSIWANGIPKPRLALNCINGQNATDCQRHLDNNSVMVTYGGMSKQPLQIATGSLIFKNILYTAFWLTRWVKDNRLTIERKEMLREICNYILNGKLKLAKPIPFEYDQYDEALKLAMSSYVNGKVILYNKYE